MSGFSYFFSPAEVTYWDAELAESFSVNISSIGKDYYGRFYQGIVQNYEVTSSEYVIYSFDMSLAFIGGYTAIAWQVVGILIGAYQSFSYELTMVASLYTEVK